MVLIRFSRFLRLVAACVEYFVSILGGSIMSMVNHARIFGAMVVLIAVLAGTTQAELSTRSYAQRHWTGGGDPYAIGTEQEGSMYSEIGDFSDPDSIVPWTHSDGHGSIAAYARASADYGALKVESFLDYTDLINDQSGNSRESFTSSASAQYTETVQVDNPGFWAGTSAPHVLVLDFRFTGSVVTTGSIKPSIRLRGLFPGGEGEGEGEDGYWDFFGSWGWPVAAGDYDETVSMWISDYEGGEVNTGVSLEVSSSNTNLWDNAGTGSCLMDFFSSCELEKIRIFDDDEMEDVVVFDGDGNVVSGDGTGWEVTRTPEPATMTLIALGMGVLLRRKRRA